MNLSLWRRFFEDFFWDKRSYMTIHFQAVSQRTSSVRWRRMGKISLRSPWSTPTISQPWRSALSLRPARSWRRPSILVAKRWEWLWDTGLLFSKQHAGCHPGICPVFLVQFFPHHCSEGKRVLTCQAHAISLCDRSTPSAHRLFKLVTRSSRC